jgi:hypothetical protein
VTDAAKPVLLLSYVSKYDAFDLPFHGLYRVTETIRANFLLVDKLMSSVKKVFVKAPYSFKAVASNVPLPPEPILTH